MLEIVAVFWLIGHIGRVVEAKGHKSGKYKWMAVGLWFGGEILGAIAGAVLGALIGGENAQCVAYLAALAGAVLGAVLANTIANNLEPAEQSPSITTQ